MSVKAPLMYNKCVLTRDIQVLTNLTELTNVDCSCLPLVLACIHVPSISSQHNVARNSK